MFYIWFRLVFPKVDNITFWGHLGKMDACVIVIATSTIGGIFCLWVDLWQEEGME